MNNSTAYSMTVTKIETGVTKTRMIVLDDEKFKYYLSKIGIENKGFIVRAISEIY